MLLALKKMRLLVIVLIILIVNPIITIVAVSGRILIA